MKKSPCPLLFEKISKWIEEFSFTKIPIKYLEWSFSKSRGPGGQNVNKLNSKVNLSVIPHEDWLPMELISKLKQEKNTQLIFKSDVYRHQHLNQKQCQQLLVQHLKKCAIKVAPPPPSIAQQAKVAQLEKKSHESRELLKRYLSRKKQDRMFNNKNKRENDEF